jgi:hypothetical protein
MSAAQSASGYTVRLTTRWFVPKSFCGRTKPLQGSILPRFPAQPDFSSLKFALHKDTNARKLRWMGRKSLANRGPFLEASVAQALDNSSNLSEVVLWLGGSTPD